jgi:hypothetical protein
VRTFVLMRHSRASSLSQKERERFTFSQCSSKEIRKEGKVPWSERKSAIIKGVNQRHLPHTTHIKINGNLYADNPGKMVTFHIHSLMYFCGDFLDVKRNLLNDKIHFTCSSSYF